MGIAERRERERAERREEIIDAAERAFFRKGAIAATMDDVAAEAELSKGTLYLYFKSKDELFMAIGSRVVSRMRAAVEQIPDDLSGFEQLQRFVQLQREAATKYPDQFRVMVAWLASGFHADAQSSGFAEYQENTGAMFCRVVNIIEDGKRDGSIRADIDAVSLVLQLWGCSLGIRMLFFSRDELAKRLPFTLEMQDLPRVVTEMILNSARPSTCPGGDS